MFNLFKKPVTEKEFAEALGMIVGNEFSRENVFQDTQGKELFSKQERMFLLIAHLDQVLESKGMDRVREQFLTYCAAHFSTNSSAEATERRLKMLRSQNTVIRQFFRDISSAKQGDALRGLLGRKFLFEKDLDTPNKMLALQACVLDKKMLDEILESSLRKVRIREAA